MIRNMISYFKKYKEWKEVKDNPEEFLTSTGKAFAQTPFIIALLWETLVLVVSLILGFFTIKWLAFKVLFFISVLLIILTLSMYLVTLKMLRGASKKISSKIGGKKS